MLGELIVKKNALLFVISIFAFISCQVERNIPSNYEIIEENFINENYKTVIELLESPEITHKEKTDWYYFFYGVSLYKINQSNSIKRL